MFGDAAAYERFMGRWSAALAPPFLDLVLDGPPDVVCDVGCGTGNLSAEVLDRHPSCRVTGVDPSPVFVAAALERLGRRGGHFVVGGAERLPLGDGEADATLSLLVLNFVADPVAAVTEMRRVTRRGGVVASAVWDYAGGMAMLRTFWDAAASLWPGAVDEALDRPVEGGGAARVLEQAGLDEVAEGLIEVSMRFPSFADYWEPFLGGAGPAGAYAFGLSDADRAALRAELESRLGPGPFELTSVARWARGRNPG